MLKYIFILILCACSFTKRSWTQKKNNDTRFGFQYKPVLPVSFFNVKPLELTNGDFSSTVNQQLGHNIGALIRWNLMKRFSLESGVNYVRRNFKFETNVNSSNRSDKGEFGIVGYEIPIKAAVNVQLSRSSYLWVSTGLATNWIASDVATETTESNFYQVTYTKKLNIAYLANVGYEFATRDKGNFYIGASLNTPFNAIGLIDIHYDEFNVQNQLLTGELLGNYLTLDLRYFFHERKEKGIPKNDL